MKIHIISLQRTGSKALYKAVHNALDNPLKFTNGDELGEFLHCWSYYGYKFGRNAEKPFDKFAPIVFRTSSLYKEFEGKAFDVKESPWVNDDLQWEERMHTDWLLQSDVADRLNICKNSHRNLVVKTQLASLYEDLGGQSLPTRELSESFDSTIFLSPDDPTKWLCSNFLCDYSGIFTACDDQEAAAQELKAKPITAPLDYIRELKTRLRRHFELVNSGKFNPSIRLWTSELLNGYAESEIEISLGLKVKIDNTPEFSAFDYPSMIANYDQIVDEMELE